MPSKPREQWIPNHQLREARERVYGRKSRTPFANAVKRRCNERFGGGCGVDHRKVRRWEEGQCVPDICHQEVICELFDVPWEEREQLGFGVVDQSPLSQSVPADGMGLAVASGLIIGDSGTSAASGFALVNGQGGVCGGQNGAAGVAKNGRSRQEGTKAKRREFMRLVRAFACTPVPLDALERFSAYCERPRAVDEALVRDVERLTAAVGAAYDTTAARQLLVPARLLMERTTRLLAGSMFSAERERLMHCASEGALVIGWLGFNLGERADARAYFLLTQDLAREAPDDVVQARALGALSTLHSTTYEGGNTVRALELAEQANAIVPEHAPAGVRAYLAIREAVEHAASHDVSGYGRLTERAEEAGSLGQSEPGLFAGWDEGALSGPKGRCLWLLNKPSEAEVILLDGLKHALHARRRAKIANSLIRVYVAQDDPEAACSTGVKALGGILDVRYVLGLKRLLVVRQDFLGAWAELSYVQEFDELLQAAVRRFW